MRALDLLRISKSEELLGLDEAECGGNAYEIENVNILAYGSVTSEPKKEEEVQVEKEEVIVNNLEIDTNRK